MKKLSLKSGFVLIIFVVFIGSFILPEYSAAGQNEPQNDPIDSSDPLPTPFNTSEASLNAPLIAVNYPPNAEIIADQYIIVYRSDFQTASFQNQISQSIAANGGKVSKVFKYAVNGVSAYLPPVALGWVLADPNVEYVEAESMFSADQEITTSTVQTNAIWNLDRVDQHILPLNRTYNYSNNGSGVNVYVLDSGINSTHTQFGTRASKDYDAIGDGQNGNDCSGHGTHVAGTIGGSTYGVAKGVRLHAVRVLDCTGKGTTSQLIAGMDWLLSHHVHPAVVNMSLDGPVSKLVNDAVNALINHGIVVVTAAGNESEDACNHSPASVPNALTVGATTATDQRANYSNYGSCLDLFAPGSSVTSAWIGSTTATKILSGTSMAAPHVTGVAAIYLQSHGSASVATVSKVILDASTKNLITNPGTNSPNKLVYSLVSGGEPSIPIVVSPSGSISDSTPIYRWSSISNASKYHIQLYKNTTIILDRDIYSSTNCSGYTCTYVNPYYLADYSYKWRVRAYIGSSWRSYTSLTPFTVFSEIPGFVSDFTNDSNGWLVVKGSWGLAGGTYRSWGALYKSDSVMHENNYPTLDYTVVMRRTVDKTGANRITIYGTPEPLFGSYHWYQGFTFQYTNDQKFLIYRSVAGVEDILVPWTPSNYINAYGWNKIRIIASSKSHLLKFYINDHLVAYGTDTSLANGRVGFGMYQAVASSPLYVTYARVVTPYSATLSTTSIPEDAVTFTDLSAVGVDLDRSPE